MREEIEKSLRKIIKEVLELITLPIETPVPFKVKVPFPPPKVNVELVDIGKLIIGPVVKAGVISTLSSAYIFTVL